MTTLMSNAPGSNAFVLHFSTPQSIQAAIEGNPGRDIPLGEAVEVGSWAIWRKDGRTMTLFRPGGDNNSVLALTLASKTGVVAEAWKKGRSQSCLSRSEQIEDVIALRCDDRELSYRCAKEARASTREAELLQEIAELRNALAQAGHCAAAGLEGARAINASLEEELARLNREKDELEAVHDLHNVNLQKARERIEELKAKLAVIDTAVTAGKDPVFQSVPFRKILKQAQTAMGNLEKAYAILVQGKELLEDVRGKAVLTSGVVSADQDTIPPLTVDGNSDDNDDDDSFLDIYDPEPVDN